MEDKKLLTIALLELAKANINELKRIEKRLADILDVEEDEGYYGQVSDAIWSGGEITADELLERLDED